MCGFVARIITSAQRFGQIIRDEIAETVAKPNEIDDESRYLLGVVGPWQPDAAISHFHSWRRQLEHGLVIIGQFEELFTRTVIRIDALRQ